MAKFSQRAFALFFAILFLVTSSFLAVAFILSNIEAKDNAKGTNSSQPPTSSAQNSDPAATAAQQGQQLPGYTPVPTVSKLKITDLAVGTGATVKPQQTISVAYSGAVASTGVIFQTSSSPISISLGSVIEGWQLGMPGMKVGGTRQLLIPATEAYGASPPSGSGIPANAALVFNVTVTAITGS